MDIEHRKVLGFTTGEDLRACDVHGRCLKSHAPHCVARWQCTRNSVVAKVNQIHHLIERNMVGAERGSG